MSDEHSTTTANILADTGDWLAKLAKSIPGTAGLGIAGAAALAKTTAEIMRARGESIDQILKRVRAPRDIRFEWEKGAEPITREETPRAKKKGDL